MGWSTFHIYENMHFSAAVAFSNNLVNMCALNQNLIFHEGLTADATSVRIQRTKLSEFLCTI